MIFQDISRRVVGSVFMNIFSSIVFSILLFAEIFYQNCKAVYGDYGHERVKEMFL